MLHSEISRLLNVSTRTVSRYVQLFDTTGDVQPKARRYGPQRLLSEYEQLILLRIIVENPGIYLHEIKLKCLDLCGVDISESTLPVC